jgi:hypothetical protein
MGRIVVMNHVTLDGVMQGPGRPDEDLLASWNARGGPFREALNDARKYVASSDPSARLDWPNSTLLRGDIPAAVADLTQSSGTSLVIMGSGVLMGSLMAADLIDEYLLMIPRSSSAPDDGCSRRACTHRCGLPTASRRPLAS